MEEKENRLTIKVKRKETKPKQVRAITVLKCRI